jgi:antitoxin YefM
MVLHAPTVAKSGRRETLPRSCGEALRTPMFCVQYIAYTLHVVVELCTVYLYIFKGASMTIQTSYTDARARLASLLDQVTHDNEVVIIQRRNEADVAMIAADELRSLQETAHLLRSPRNAERLLRALARAEAGEGEPQSIDDLKREVGLAEEA